jgi:hypothetical protein
VHLLPNVIAELKKQRKQNPGTTWVFEGPHVFPLDLATLGSKIIKKTLQGAGVEWHGFHAFRRGLGTRLYNNGTPIETVAKVLRHGSGSEVTLKYYVEVEEETKAARCRVCREKSRKLRGIRFYLHLPGTMDGKQYKGPFMHRPDDGDSSAVTFWNTNMNDLQDLFASALKAIEERQLRNPKV